MSTADHGIVVAVDGSEEAGAAVRWAVQEATLRNTALTLLHVVAPMVMSWPVGQYLGSSAYLGSIVEWQQENAQHVLAQSEQAARAGAAETASLAVHSELVNADVVSALAEASKTAQLTVVGSRGRGALSRAILGSVSTGLVQHGHGNVAVVHTTDGVLPDSTLPVLLGVDGSSTSEAATALAFDEASRRGVDLVALHAWTDVTAYTPLGVEWGRYEDEGHEVLAERLAGWQEQYPEVTVHRRLVGSRPAHWLVEESERSQLVIVGSHGRGGFAGMVLGSVSRAVAQAAHAPVIVCRPR